MLTKRTYYDDGRDRRELLERQYNKFRRLGPWLYITMRYRDSAILDPLVLYPNKPIDHPDSIRFHEFMTDVAVFSMDRQWLKEQQRRKKRGL